MSASEAGAAQAPTLAGATVAVVGLGLIGGSLVRALARLPDPPRVLGASPDAADRAGAESEHGVHTVADAAQVVGAAQVVVYAAPMSAILEMLPAHASLFRPDALVTDVAGLKRPVLEGVRRAGLVRRYIGSHPMAGGEGAGFEEGGPDLFRDALVWLCADDGVDPAVAERAEMVWRALGARPVWTDPDVHDRLMVRVSHLPQLVANALALALHAQGVSPAELGPGGRDMIRLAESPARMWSDLLAHTGPEAAGLLREVATWIEEVAARLEQGDAAAVSDLMTRTREWRSGPRREGRS